MVAVSTCGGAAVCVDGQGLRRATPDGVSGGGSDRCVHGMGHPQGSRGRRRVDQPDSAGGTLANLQLHSLQKRGWGTYPRRNVVCHPSLTPSYTPDSYYRPATNDRVLSM